MLTFGKFLKYESHGTEIFRVRGFEIFLYGREILGRFWDFF